MFALRFCAVVLGAYAAVAPVRAQLMTNAGNNRVYPPLTVTCTTNAALSGTYSVGDDLMGQITDLMLLAQSRTPPAFFPAMGTIVFLDTSNKPHSVTSYTSLQTFFGLLSIYRQQIYTYQNTNLSGGSGTLPSPTASGPC